MGGYDYDNLLARRVTYISPDGYTRIGRVRGVTLQPRQKDENNELVPPATWFLVELDDGRFKEVPAYTCTLIR